jgi:hypothetical protein
METKIMGIEEITLIKKAIDMLLKVPGIIYDKVYWFDKLGKKLNTPIKQWFDIQHQIYLKYAVPVPETPFIPYNKYPAFKKECFEDNKHSPENWPDIFEKYEIISNAAGTIAIPIEKQKEYDKEVNESFDSFQKEIEFNKVETDQEFMAALRYLPGELQLVLDFMLIKVEPSSLVMPFKKGILQ